ncbi:MAG: O-antigen ligase family protein [Syntrophales bacterium]
MNWSYRAIGRGTDRGAGWAAVALGFSLPISTALDEILLVAILALWLAGGRLREKISAVGHNPIVVPSLLLFAMYIVGLLYGDAAPREALGSLSKAANLLYIPILLFFFREERTRRRALAGFLAAMALTIVISYLLWMGIMPPLDLFHITPDDAYTPFKHRITHGFLMAYGAFLFGLEARRQERRSLRIISAVLGLAALANVLFVVSGRTGYVVALALGFYFLVCQWRWRGVAAALGAFVALSGTVYLMPASVPHQRIAQMAEEMTNWQPGRPEATSVGYRLEYYRNSLRLIVQRPLLGAGTGGFKGVYAALVKGTGMDPSENPHNEYLMVTVQLGLAGLVLMLWLFFVQWRRAASLPGGFAGPAARGLVLLVLSASMVTSTLIDHTEGLVYVWMSALLFAGWPAGVGQTRGCSERCHYRSS